MGAKNKKNKNACFGSVKTRLELKIRPLGYFQIPRRLVMCLVAPRPLNISPNLEFPQHMEARPTTGGGSQEYAGAPWAPHGSPGGPMGPQGPPWASGGAHGSPWAPPGPPGRPMGPHGPTQGLRGGQRVPKGPWVPWAHPGIPWAPPGAPG